MSAMAAGVTDKRWDVSDDRHSAAGKWEFHAADYLLFLHRTRAAKVLKISKSGL
jgi:hypothetical protein